MTQKVIQTGNSLAITIPKRFVKIIGITVGQEVEVVADHLASTLVITFANSAQLPLISK